MKGVWKFTLRDAVTGSVIDYKEVCNSITYFGVGHILDVARGRTNVDAISTTGSTWMSVGTGSYNFTSWCGSLNTEVSGAGNLGRQHPSNVSRSSYTNLISTTYDTTIGSGALTEAGVFVKGYASGNVLANAGSSLNSGVLFNYVSFGIINKDSSNTLQADYEVKLNE